MGAVVVKTHYEALNVTRSASYQDLRSRWRELSRKLHPDRHGSTPEANAAFADISVAYAVLADPKRRKAYNIELDLLTDPCPLCKGVGEIYKSIGFTGRQVLPCGVCKGAGRVGRK